MNVGADTIRPRAAGSRPYIDRRIDIPCGPLGHLTLHRGGIKKDGAEAPSFEGLVVKNYFAAFASFQAAIFARMSLLMHQMKVKQQKEPRAATMGKPTTIILMPAMVAGA